MRIISLAGVLVGLALVAGACGDDSTSSTPPADTATSTVATTGPDSPPDSTVSETVPDGTASEDAEPESTASESTEPEHTEPGGDATEPAVPTAIVSLSPSATEMVFAVGAGDQVLAVDDFSNYPPEAAAKMQGLSGYEPNVESIAGLEPDLVLTDGTNPDLLAQLDSLGIEHWEGPAASVFDDVYAQIEQLGALTGHVGEAAELVAQMQADVADVVAGLPDLAEPLTYYHELDDTFFSVTSETFLGAVYAEIGLVNIADAAGEGNPYPQLSAEYVISADPDLIFLACTKYCEASAESVAARPGWESLTAIATGGVIEMDDDIASRWGPRIVDHLRMAGDAVARVGALQDAG